MARRLLETPRPIREVRETVPEGVAQAVARALAKSPADRFATAAEFARALEESGSRTVAAAPSPATQPTVPAPAARPSGRRAPLTLALGIGFVLGLGVLFGWLRSHGAVEPDRTRAPPGCSRCSRSRTWATRPTSTSPTASPTRSAASWPRCRGLR